MSSRCLLALAVLLVGCGSAVPAEEDVAESAQAVVGGSATPDELGFDIDRFQRNAVAGQLYKSGPLTSQGCSGTVVGDRVVVSAAHCVVANQAAWFGGAAPQLVSPDNLFYALGDDARNPLCSLAAESIHLHPDVTITPTGVIVHDISITILKDSVIATCPAVVPVQLNRDPIPASFVGQRFLQGGFGALDASYNFSHIRYWSLLRMTAIGDDYVVMADDQHGFPSFGDSGSGLLHWFPDGALRTIGMDSLGVGVMGSFVRSDDQAALLDQVLTADVVCGTVGPEGICRDGAVVACGPNGFTSEDCTEAGRDCVVDGQGAAQCACSCDTDPNTCQPDCACDAQCPCQCDGTGGCAPGCACVTEPAASVDGGGCALGVTPGRGGSGWGPAALLLSALTLGRRRWRRALVPGGVLAAAALAAHAGCSSDSPESGTTVCSLQDAGTELDAGGAGGGTSDASGSCATLADMLNADACGPGFACDIADFIANTVGCRPAGSTPAYAECSALTPACVAGTTCNGMDPSHYECLPYCDTASGGTCPGGGVCLVQIAANTTVSLCLAPDDCDPITQAPCSQDWGLACYFVDDSGKGFCLYPGNASAGASCSADTDCRAGYGCKGGPPTVCSKWCHLPGDCTLPATCLGIGDIPGHTDLGYCG